MEWMLFVARMLQIFEWDKDKAESNLRKHEISFWEAASVFSDPLSLTIDDPIHSLEEQRFVIIGVSEYERLLVVVHTIRGENIRIISARQATRQERKTYEG